jgi:hypothetical protein
MNPRILKKLSKRVVAIGRPRDVSIDIQADPVQDSEYCPRHASRKPSHREAPWRKTSYSDGKPCLGDMYSWRGTPWYCWSSSTMDGTEYDGRVAWQYMTDWVRGDIEEGALDWDHPSCAEGGWPPLKDGKAPKYPRNTSAMLRAIDVACDKPWMQRIKSN